MLRGCVIGMDGWLFVGVVFDVWYVDVDGFYFGFYFDLL